MIRSESCSACPYRRDVPSGVWSAEDYDKLPPYDAPTFGQPSAPFACHATPEFFCHGWAACHSNRGNEFDLLALRLAGMQGKFDGNYPDPDDRLFDSGAEAAEHGKADIDDPSEAAVETMARLGRKYERLR